MQCTGRSWLADANLYNRPKVSTQFRTGQGASMFMGEDRPQLTSRAASSGPRWAGESP